jgi:hypothetical protein
VTGGAPRCREREKMKGSFLKKLYNDKALHLVAPSDEIKTAYVRKSESFLASVRLLLDNDRFEESVSMAYYSMYYSVLVLFLRKRSSARIIPQQSSFSMMSLASTARPLNRQRRSVSTNNIMSRPHPSVTRLLTSSKRQSRSMPDFSMSLTG